MMNRVYTGGIPARRGAAAGERRLVKLPGGGSGRDLLRRLRGGGCPARRGERERERDEAIPFSCKYVVAACKDG